ncbi:MAG TPA: glycoside hydrolase family 2 TIM barrel-domain containing protein [Mycobacteriales bacterium]|nr:glycoside hydrolase family 2 TIM barrel-domain containing protein [Mycobacteriales bacterium]
MSAPLAFDEYGVASLDGVWAFTPEGGEPTTIEVPGLWEAQGHLELDGAAEYCRRFALADTAGYWTLTFGAVMDLAEVWLNGTRLGEHDSAFTPFSFDVSGLLRDDNELRVRVYDPSLAEPEHIRLPHGKQGWANNHFPSRPSLYMTYGGIWQSVTLRRHGPLVVDDVFVNADPDDLRVRVEVTNRGAEPVAARLGVRAVARVRIEDVTVAPGATEVVEAAFGATDAKRWSPAAPNLYTALVDVLVGGEQSDTARVRFGLRTLRLDGPTLLIDGEPYRMKSVLVQGFTADRLYAEGTREEVEREVRAARDMGFNTLRLHIKAFDPVYLDVCDELGMLLECDLPVAEPIDHDDMGADTETARACLRAIREQVRRDRNHPSVILWAAMNELTLDREGAHYWDSYEEFAKTLYDAVVELDPTRPCIENEWVEPEPERVFRSPILTAHWYGRLHAEYLAKLERESARYRDVGMPLYVTEYGDWGLPQMPLLPDAPFWDTHDIYATGLAASLWPSTVARFVTETQRYQGLSDRLQTEVFRRHDHIGGYCLTELTDVPHELNGVLDLHRNPKPLAVAEVVRMNQTVLPMLELESLVHTAGTLLSAPLHVSNDGPALADVTVEVRFGDTAASLSPEELAGLDASELNEAKALARFDESSWGTRIPVLDAYRAAPHGEVVIAVPEVPGSHDLVLRLSAGGVPVAENRYPIHVVRPPDAAYAVRVVGERRTAEALSLVGATVGDDGPTFVAEYGLTPDLTADLAERLARGETVVVLAQRAEAGPHYPVPAEIVDVETVWGSTVFHFTTDEGSLPSLPRRAVLVAEDSTIQATAIVVRLGGEAWPDVPEVIAYKPAPNAVTGRIVGSHRVGAGRLVVCQYRLVGPALRGDAAALAVLSDLVRWAADPPPRLTRDRLVKDDGRTVTFYSWEPVA